jgi:transposase IS166 family protein
LLKEKVDLLIRRLFGAKSEKLDVAPLELLLKEADLGKADASAEKAEAAPITGGALCPPRPLPLVGQVALASHAGLSRSIAI